MASIEVSLDHDDDSGDDLSSSSSDSYTHEFYNATDDDSSTAAGLSSTGASTTRADRKPAIAEKETRHIERWRIILVVVLICVATAVCAGTYLFVQDEATNDYKLSFNLFANSIETTLGHHVENLEEGLRNLGDTISSSSDATRAFPLVHVDKFEVHGEHARARSKMEAITYAPLVSSSQLTEWETFSVENQDWIQASRATYLDHTEIAPVYLPGKISPFIYRRRDGIFPEPVEAAEDDTATFAPIWYLSPPPFNPAIVNFDVFSRPEYQGIVQHAITNKRSAFSPVLDVEKYLSLQVSDSDHLSYHEQFTNIAEGIAYDQPHSMYAQPVFESTTSDKVVGVLLGVLAWDVYLAELVPPGVTGLICVLHSTCDEDTTYTYELNGATPTYLGEGDLHDQSFNPLVRRVSFFKTDGSTAASPRSATFSQPGNRSAVCNYSVDLYPSKTFEETYDSSIAAIATVTVGATFAIVAFIFLVYDALVNKRNKKVTAAAERSDAVVNSLFPAEVRDRLMQADNEGDGDLGESNGSLGIVGGDPSNSSKPIADLFPSVTIFFGDIVGFTAWSSTREPSQVFLLLETIYSEFDLMARRRKVFKVETIGDCYVAACGLPRPNNQHPVVMARFARDCVSKFEKLTNELEVTLGPDTADLGIRIGIHSGPVTAGVLRGDRARFQLFGDSMNTAARIESSGARNRIHCSEETANLLKAAGKEFWLVAREDRIHAKGKGELQTYWIDIVNKPKGSSNGSRSIVDGSDSKSMSFSIEEAENAELVARRQRLCSKTQRLIEWNVDMLEKLLEKIVARRTAMLGEGAEAQSVAPIEFTAQGNPLDEVVEIIALPEFHGHREVKVSIPAKVIDELRSFVSSIAAMYNANAFHSFEHASHVTMSVAKLLSRIVAPTHVLDSYQGGQQDLAATLHDHTYGITSDPLTQFACLISAMIHDVDHQGVPNNQLVKENAAVAAAYKTSPAEQNSIDLAWGLFMQDQYQELRNTICGTPDEFARFRALVVNSVMATDIMDKDLKVLRNARWDRAFNESHKDEDPRDTVNRKATIVIEHLIQASDVAHTMQHWHIYRKWNERFFEECYSAYRNGRAPSDPSENWFRGELGFFDFYIIPLAKKLKDCGVFGVSSDEYLNFAEANRREWEERGQEVVASMVAKVQKEWSERGSPPAIHHEQSPFLCVPRIQTKRRKSLSASANSEVSV